MMQIGGRDPRVLGIDRNTSHSPDRTLGSDGRARSHNLSTHRGALPQALAYMMTTPDPEQPTYGLVSNGAYFMFLKLILGERSHYALSSDFSLYRQRNELRDVLTILKQIGQRL